MIVRRVRPDEAGALARTRLAALKDSPFAFGSAYDVEATRTDAEWIERARLGADGIDRVTFLAAADDRIVGLVGGVRPGDNRSVVDLVSMWTAPEARRSGVGRALVGAVIDWAREGGATAVDLWVTRGNEPAQRLYESVGFRETGDAQALPSDPCKDEVRMRLVP